MPVENAVVAAEHHQTAAILERRMTAPPHRNRAGRLRRMPLACPQVQVHDLRTVDLLLRVKRTVPIAAAAKHVHAIVENRGRVEVPIAGRRLGGRQKRPRHRHQVQAVHVARELIDLLLEAAEDVHELVDDARRMAIANARNATGNLRLRPGVRARIEAEQNVAAHIVVAAAPHVHVVSVRNGGVTVSLERNLWVFEQAAGGAIGARRHQGPAQRLRVQHMDVDGLNRAIVLAAAVAAERVDAVADDDGRVVDATRSAFESGDPVHDDDDEDKDETMKMGRMLGCGDVVSWQKGIR